MTTATMYFGIGPYSGPGNYSGKVTLTSANPPPVAGETATLHVEWMGQKGFIEITVKPGQDWLQAATARLRQDPSAIRPALHTTTPTLAPRRGSATLCGS